MRQAEAWRWSSLWHRESGSAALLLDAGPLAWPADWTAWVNQAQTEAELESLRRSVRRSCPYGSEPWQRTTAERLGLQSTLRPRGRPRKEE